MSKKASLNTITNTNTSTSLSLAELPPEILHTVGSFLDEKDARVWRLTCRKMGAVASCYAFQQLTFYLYHGDFEMLKHFANHDIFSKYVRSLIYVTDVLPERRMSLNKFITKKKTSDDLWYKTLQPIVRPQARTRLPLERPKYSDHDFEVVYHKYLDAHARQTDILATAEDFALFRDILPKFTGLRHIMVSAESWFREFMWARRPFDAIFVQAHDDLQPSACRQVASLLLPLVGQSPTLESLRLGTVHWSFVRQLEDSMRLSQLSDICRNLTTFDIMIDTGINRHDEVGIWVSQCKKTVQKGHLRSLMEAMPNLVSLTVGFSFINEDDDLYPASFRDLVSANAHWEHLRSVKFDVLEAPRQQLVDFFRCHSSTLRTIELKDLRLINSSWHVFLPQLRELADDMFLDGILLVGFVQGESEDEGTPPEISEERFVLGYPEHGSSAHLAEEITDYIIWGQGPCPLEPYRNY